MPTNAQRKELINRYKALFTEAPKWAWPFPPSIPFVGHKYKPGSGILIYASAENLVGIDKEPSYRARFTGKAVWDRYRAWYDLFGQSVGTFFPDIGIAPVTNGGLMAAGLFLAMKLKLPRAATPRGLLEKLAISNWCKFTIQSERNIDYIGNKSKTLASLGYVVAELTALRPAIVILPSRVWHQPVMREAMRGASAFTRFLPVPQFTPRVVNHTLKPCEALARSLNRSHKGNTLGQWMMNLQGVNKPHAWRYLAAVAKGLV